MFTSVNEPLGADDEKFYKFFFSQVESVITINLERKKKVDVKLRCCKMELTKN